MNEVSKRIFELLVEVKNICEKNCIDYYLNYNLLEGLLEQDILTTKNAYLISIKADDVYKFIENANKNENRIVDSLLTSPNFLGTHLKYVDTTTLYYQISRGTSFKYPGIAVNINILRYNPKSNISKILNNVLQSGIEVLNDYNFNTNKKVLLGAAYIFFLGIIGKKNRSKYIFNRIYNSSKDKMNKKSLIHKPFLQRRIDINSSLLEKKKTVKINNVTFDVLEDPKYGDLFVNYNNYVINTKINKNDYIIDLFTSYKDFFEEVKKQRIKISTSFSQKIQLSFKNRKIKKYRKYVMHCWDIMYRTEDRFNLFEQYNSQKSEILSLYSKKEFEKLRLILNDYIVLLKKYADKKMGISFDPVIFGITMEVLLNEGKNDEVKEYIKLVPKEFLIPLKEETK